MKFSGTGVAQWVATCRGPAASNILTQVRYDPCTGAVLACGMYGPDAGCTVAGPPLSTQQQQQLPGYHPETHGLNSSAPSATSQSSTTSRYGTFIASFATADGKLNYAQPAVSGAVGPSIAVCADGSLALGVGYADAPSGPGVRHAYDARLATPVIGPRWSAAASSLTPTSTLANNTTPGLLPAINADTGAAMANCALVKYSTYRTSNYEVRASPATTIPGKRKVVLNRLAAPVRVAFVSSTPAFSATLLPSNVTLAPGERREAVWMGRDWCIL
jgi:hypothetical protein